MTVIKQLCALAEMTADLRPSTHRRGIELRSLQFRFGLMSFYRRLNKGHVGKMAAWFALVGPYTLNFVIHESVDSTDPWREGSVNLSFLVEDGRRMSAGFSHRDFLIKQRPLPKTLLLAMP